MLGTGLKLACLAASTVKSSIDVSIAAVPELADRSSRANCSLQPSLLQQRRCKAVHLTAQTDDNPETRLCMCYALRKLICTECSVITCCRYNFDVMHCNCQWPALQSTSFGSTTHCIQRTIVSSTNAPGLGPVSTRCDRQSSLPNRTLLCHRNELTQIEQRHRNSSAMGCLV